MIWIHAELYEQAIKYEKGSFITSSGALATMSGAKTGRSPRDKRVVKDETTEDLWWGKWVCIFYLFISSNNFIQLFNFIHRIKMCDMIFTRFEWRGRGSPNIEMDEHTFMVNRERAVDYLCSLEKVFHFLISSFQFYVTTLIQHYFLF